MAAFAGCFSGHRTLSTFLVLVSFAGFSIRTLPTYGQAANAGPDPDQLLRQLDTDGDGKVTLAESGPGAQPLVRRMLEMAGKGVGDALSRDDIRRVVELHRRQTAGTRPTSPNTRPSDAPSGTANNSSASSPLDPANADKRNASRPNSSSVRGTRPSRPTAGSNSRVANSDRALQSRLAGTWRGWVVDGRGENPETGHMQMELRVENQRMFGRELGTQRAPQGLGDGEFTVAGTAEAGTLDAVATTGQHAGREYPGIFRLEGDTLHWCVNNRQGSRPSEYETGRGNYYMILRRQP